MLLKNKFAVVTGASTGIGRATAICLAQKGARVALVSRNKVELEKTKKIIGDKAEIFQADLSNLTSIKDLITKIKKKTRKVDFLINIAGVWHGKNEVYANTNFENFSLKVILETYFVGIIAPTLLAHAFVTLMPPRSKIVNLSGTFEDGAKGWLPYFVSKKALEDLTVGLSEELASKDIQVNCVSPSDVATEAYKKYFPQYLKNAVTPEAVAKKILFFCSGKADKLTGRIVVVKKL